VGDVGFLSQSVLTDVERGQPTRKELAADHALGKSVDGAKTELGLASSSTPSPTSRLLREPSRKTISNQPISETAVDQMALAARLAHHFGVMATPVTSHVVAFDDAKHRNRQSSR
jgi:hypothetical protein